jgi:hypothetical protein
MAKGPMLRNGEPCPYTTYAQNLRRAAVAPAAVANDVPEETPEVPAEPPEELIEAVTESFEQL